MKVNVIGSYILNLTTLLLEADGFRKLDILHTSHGPILWCFFTFDNVIVHATWQCNSTCNMKKKKERKSIIYGQNKPYNSLNSLGFWMPVECMELVHSTDYYLVLPIPI